MSVLDVSDDDLLFESSYMTRDERRFETNEEVSGAKEMRCDLTNALFDDEDAIIRTVSSASLTEQRKHADNREGRIP
jgi:hypothetical protein